MFVGLFALLCSIDCSQGESGAARGTREAAAFLALEGRVQELERFADDAIRDLAPKRWKPHPGLPDPTVPV